MTNNSKQQVLDLHEDIKINPDAIVSRTISKADSFNLTLFAFDQGQALSAHSSPMDAWVQIISGRMEITVGADSFSLTSGKLLLMPAGIPHALVALEPSQMLLTMLKPIRGKE